jgi:hypothetical protein
MWVWRLDDHTLVALGAGAWVSNDGRAWKPLAQPASLKPSTSDFLTDGRHGIQLDGTKGTLADPYSGEMSLSTWTNGGLVALPQSGDQPPYDVGFTSAIGPTGVVVTDHGQLWIGLPSSS